MRKISPKFLYITVIILFILLILIDLKTDAIRRISSTNAYYLFSSAAQTIAAFIALLIAGYTFANTNSKKVKKDDQSYNETQQIFLEKHFAELVVLSLITAIAIILNLFSIIIVDKIFYNTIIYYFTILFTFSSIISGLIFVFDVVDPNKYSNAFEKTTKELSNTFKHDKTVDSKNEMRELNKYNYLNGRELFIDNFIRLEKDMRKFLNKYSNLKEKVHYSATQMLRELYRLEVIDKNMMDRLQLIVNVRNLIVHGHISTVDVEVARDLRRVLFQLKRQIEKHIEKNQTESLFGRIEK